MKYPGIGELITWVYTANLESTARFYADRLGLDEVRDEGSARIFRVSGSGYIGVCLAGADRVVEPAGGMITVVTDEVDGWYQRLRANGVPIDDPPHVLETFGIYTFFARDPNGYVIEFQQFL